MTANTASESVEFEHEDETQLLMLSRSFSLEQRQSQPFEDEQSVPFQLPKQSDAQSGPMAAAEETRRAARDRV